MIHITDKVQCCGCNACGDICPKQAISFKIDNEGFWYPEVNKQICVDCGLCEKVCPIININTLKKNDLPKSICYAAEHKNLEIVFDSTSGGAFSALAEIMYRSNGFVGGAVFNDDFSVRHFVSNDKEDLVRLRSSKYLQSNLEGFFIEVKELLNKREKVLVCGSPCQMAALRAFLHKDYDNLIIADYICRGINSPKVWKKYIASFEERYGSPVVYAKAKSKEYGWRNLTQKVILADGRHVYETVDQSNFTKGYLQTGVYCRPSCYDCKFKGYPRISDITLADFWGIERIDSSMDKDLGTSLVMVNSNKGVAFFEEAKKRLNYREVTIEDVERGNGHLNRSLDPPKVNRDEFFIDLDRMTFSEIADKYIKNGNVGLKRRVKKHLGNILRVCKITRLNPSAIFKLFKYNSIKDLLEGNILVFTPHACLMIKKGARIKKNGFIIIGHKTFPKSKLETRLWIGENAIVEFNGNVTIGYGADIEVFPNANLIFGNGVGTNINTTIICQEKIEIGNNCMFGRSITIRDNNGKHYLNRSGYKNSRPIKIGDKAWLCEGCTIMPGVKVGEGAIIGAHAFVTQNVTAHSVVSGNPAQVVDTDVLWKY